jgi:hypothetical protein
VISINVHGSEEGGTGQCNGDEDETGGEKPVLRFPGQADGLAANLSARVHPRPFL